MSTSTREEFDRAVGEWVRDRRKGIGINQQALAKHTGLIHQTTVARLESGERSMRLYEARVFEAAFGVTIPAFVVTVPCVACGGRPRPGFTCNACGSGANS